MKTFACTILLALAAVAHGAEPPRMATVDMKTVFLQFERRTQAVAENVEQLEDLARNPRVLAVKELDEELTRLATTVRDKTQSNEVREKAANDFNSLSKEYSSLVSEMERFVQNERKRLTESFVVHWESLLAEAKATVAEIGVEKGYDLVVEVGGQTSSMLPSILYLSTDADITELVIARLNEDPADEE